MPSSDTHLSQSTNFYYLGLELLCADLRGEEGLYSFVVNPKPCMATLCLWQNACVHACMHTCLLCIFSCFVAKLCALLHLVPAIYELKCFLEFIVVECESYSFYYGLAGCVWYACDISLFEVYWLKFSRVNESYCGYASKCSCSKPVAMYLVRIL